MSRVDRLGAFERSRKDIKVVEMCQLTHEFEFWHLEKCSQYSTVQYSTVQYSTVQYSTVQYSTVQYSTVQYSTVQYSTPVNQALSDGTV